MIDRVRIVHPHDLFKGRIGYIIDVIDQHSLCTYVVVFMKKGNFLMARRAYQRNDIRFLCPVKRLPQKYKNEDRL